MGGRGARSHDGASSVLPSTTPAFSLPPWWSLKRMERDLLFHLSVARWPKFQPHNSKGVTGEKESGPKIFRPELGLICWIRGQQPRAELMSHVWFSPSLGSQFNIVLTDAKHWFYNIYKSSDMVKRPPKPFYRRSLISGKLAGKSGRELTTISPPAPPPVVFPPYCRPLWRHSEIYCTYI